MKLFFILTCVFSLNTCFSYDCLAELEKMVKDLEKEALDELPKCQKEDDFLFYLGQFGAFNRVLRSIDAVKMKNHGNALKEIDLHQKALDELSN